MKIHPIRRLPVGGIVLVFLILSSCISKKQYLEEVNTLTQGYETQIGQFIQQVNSANAQIGDLQLQLAEKKGENSALVAMQDKLQQRIDQLEADIENMSSQAISTQQTMDQRFQQKERELAETRQRLRDIETILDRFEASMSTILQDLDQALYGVDSTSYALEPRSGQAVVILAANLLFKPESANWIQKEGLDALQKISGVLVQYPAFDIRVVGHTDNRDPKKTYKDNWTFSAIRAATVVQTLTKEMNLNPNQVLAAGKGEFAPRASNVTTEGRSLNHRIELVIQPREQDLIRELRRKINN